jgi:hypothetical protein
LGAHLHQRCAALRARPAWHYCVRRAIGHPVGRFCDPATSTTPPFERLSEARCLRLALPRAPTTTKNRGLRPRATRASQALRRTACARASTRHTPPARPAAARRGRPSIVHAKARKTPPKRRARARLIEQMKKMAEAVEKERVDATPEVELCSPSAAVRVSRQETEVCQQPLRSVFGSEACAAVVDSPVAPFERI